MAVPAARDRLETRLRDGLHPSHLEIQDESAAHAGHAGAAGGGGHFRVLVVSAAFEGLGRVERHRLVYALVGDLMPGVVHALGLRTVAPSEWTG